MLVQFKHRYLIAPCSLLFVASTLWILYVFLPEVFHRVQLVVFIVGMILVGVPHGALDHVLESGSIDARIGLSFILRYIGLAIAGFLLWLLLPQVSLFFFLLYSAWHFGEADMQEWQPNTMNAIKNGFWGIIVLTVILCGHVMETNVVLSNMSVFLLPLQEAQGILMASFFLLLAVLWSCWERRPAMFLSTCVLAVGIHLPLITAFGLYFIGQHSINGWSHLKQVMKADNLSLSLKALPFTLGALLFFGLMLYSLERNMLKAFHQHAMTAFFVFIASISFPHVMAMHLFYKSYFLKHSTSPNS